MNTLQPPALATPVAPLSPFLGLTRWDGNVAAADDARLARLVNEGMHDVQLHFSLEDPNAPRALDRLRKLVPNLRWICGLAGNSLAVGPRDPALAALDRWARWAHSEGTLSLMVNDEEDERHKQGHGWSRDNWPLDYWTNELRPRMRACVQLAASYGPTSITSHDFPDWHPIPWEECLGEDSPAEWFAGQNYPGTVPPKPPAPASAMQLRLSDALAHSRPIAPRYREDGPCYGTYVQTYGCMPAALTCAADRYDRACFWTEHEMDANGLLAFRAMLRARRECGASKGALARWQAQHGLTADSEAGPLTLRAMGLLP